MHTLAQVYLSSALPVISQSTIGLPQIFNLLSTPAWLTEYATASMAYTRWRL